MSLWLLEQQHWRNGAQYVAGIDEAGRGAWAGPVVAAAVVLPADGLLRQYRDSKTLTAKQRARLGEQIKAEAIAWAVANAEASEVDKLGVLAATLAAAGRALGQLQPTADAIISDYLKIPTTLPLLAPAKADSLSYSVAAASILAKTSRDAQMQQLDGAFAGYGFAAHKGYGAPSHAKALEQLGACAAHRRTFAPVARVLGQRGLFEPD
jgi:ribonuclease HII